MLRGNRSPMSIRVNTPQTRAPLACSPRMRLDVSQQHREAARAARLALRDPAHRLAEQALCGGLYRFG